MKRIIISAISSGSGKTTITCGLLAQLKHLGFKVKSYKCGPDYIDPMFHKKVLGIPSENLDCFFADDTYIDRLLSFDDGADISVIEGAMGIYDGISGLGKEASAYDLARKSGTPIVLLVDARGIGNTLVSVVNGIISDDEFGLIKGIVLNNISSNSYVVLAPLIEERCKVKVLGFVGKLKGVKLDSRHLGLMLPEEISDLEHQIEIVRSEIEANVDMKGFLNIAETAKTIKQSEPLSKHMPKTLRLAVARDEAFCFYYVDNFRVLEAAGMELVYFSPLHDEAIPANVDGLLLGGGYPELSLKELSDNVSMRRSIKAALKSGMPSLAECGGFMYLHDYIEDSDRSYEMVGVVSGKCYNTGKLCRFGYVDLKLQKYQLKGHEFHYYDSTNCGEDGLAKKPSGNRSWNFGHYGGGKLWGFPHLYYGSCLEFVEDFAQAMREFQEKRIHE